MARTSSRRTSWVSVAPGAVLRFTLMASSSTLRLPRNCSLATRNDGGGAAGSAVSPAASGSAARADGTPSSATHSAAQTRVTAGAADADLRAIAIRVRSGLVDDQTVGHAQPPRGLRRQLVIVRDDQ